MGYLDKDDDLLGYGRYGTSAQSRPPSAGGPITPANIQLYDRPRVPLGGDDYGTVLSESREQNGQEVLYPQIYGGALHPSNTAWQHYLTTGQHMGKFANPDDADRYAQQYHLDAANGVYDTPKKFQHASRK